MPGAGYLVERLLQAIVCILGISVIVFSITYLIGDPVHLLLPPEASASDREAFRSAMGLDRPALERYGLFVLNAIQGDLGQSYRYHMPVVEVVLARFPATLELAVAAIDIKGDDFRARHKPPAKMLDFLASGVPVITNPGSSSDLFAKKNALMVLNAENWYAEWSSVNHLQFRRQAFALQEALRPDRVSEYCQRHFLNLLQDREARNDTSNRV